LVVAITADRARARATKQTRVEGSTLREYTTGSQTDTKEKERESIPVVEQIQHISSQESLLIFTDCTVVSKRVRARYQIPDTRDVIVGC